MPCVMTLLAQENRQVERDGGGSEPIRGREIQRLLQKADAAEDADRRQAVRLGRA